MRDKRRETIDKRRALRAAPQRRPGPAAGLFRVPRGQRHSRRAEPPLPVLPARDAPTPTQRGVRGRGGSGQAALGFIAFIFYILVYFILFYFVLFYFILFQTSELGPAIGHCHVPGELLELQLAQLPSLCQAGISPDREGRMALYSLSCASSAHFPWQNGPICGFAL